MSKDTGTSNDGGNERRGKRKNERHGKMHNEMHKSITEVPEQTIAEHSPSLETNSNNIIVSKA